MTYVARLAVLLSLCACVPGAWAQTIYKSVTPDGKVIYSYTPPPNSKVVESITPEVTPPSSASEDPTPGSSDAPPLVHRAPTMGSTSVTLFSATWCGYCKQAKAYLNAHGIAYRDIDIGSRQGMAALVNAEGDKNVPFLVSGNRHVQGFSSAGYDRFFSGP